MVKVRKLSALEKMLDTIMIPIMWILSGFTRDSIQETHPWHGQPVNLLLDMDLSVSVQATKARHTPEKFPWFLFHAPIFGGWREYLVLEVSEGCITPWHIGWAVVGKKPEVSRLELSGLQVKVLKGPKAVVFFAIDSHGVQIPLVIRDKGNLGDMKYPRIRLL